MAASYVDVVATRTTEPDMPTLKASLMAVDPTVAVQHVPGPKYTLKKATPWQAGQTSAALNLIETSPATSPQLDAKHAIDVLPIQTRAVISTMLDAVNQLRALHGLAAITTQQFSDSAKAKCDTLTAL